MENTSPSLELKPSLPSGWSMVKNAISFYKSNFKVILGIFLLPYLLIAAGNILYSLSFQDDAQFVTRMAIIHGVGAIITLIAMLFSFVSMIALVRFMGEQEKGIAYAGPKAAWKSSYRLLGAFVWVSILVGLVVAGGYVLLIVPGIILALYLFSSALIMIDENKRGLKALSTSWYYSKGYGWSIFGRFLLFGLTVMLPLIIILFLLLFGTKYLSGVSGMDVFTKGTSSPATSIIGGVWQFLYGMILTPLQLTFIYILYKSVKATKLVPLEETEEKRIRKWLIALPIIGILLFGGGITALISFGSLQTAREIGKAHTMELVPYENAAAGISLQYPKAWQKTEVNSYNILAVFQSEPDLKNTKNPPLVLQVLQFKFQPAEKNTTLDQFSQQIQASIQAAPDTTIAKSEMITLDNTPAFSIQVAQKFTNSDTKQMITVMNNAVYTIKNGSVYGLIFTFGQQGTSSSPAELILFQRILNSVKIK